MKKPLSLYQGQIRAIKKARSDLDIDFAQVLAEGLNEGFEIIDLLDEPRQTTQKEFDL